MAPIRRMVLDVLKPHDPSITEFAGEVAGSEGVEAVNATLVETDREVENVKFTLEGEDVDPDAVRTTVEGLGGSVHSVDEVAAGERLIEESETPQD